MEKEDDLCSFCEEQPATHFSMDWDASLCDDCEAAQAQKLDEVRAEMDEVRRKHPDASARDRVLKMLEES